MGGLTSIARGASPPSELVPGPAARALSVLAISKSDELIGSSRGGSGVLGRWAGNPTVWHAGHEGVVSVDRLDRRIQVGR